MGPLYVSWTARVSRPGRGINGAGHQSTTAAGVSSGRS